MTSADVHGKFLWHELRTTDPAAAGAFYTKVLGWKPQPWDRNPSYTLWMADKGPVGGATRLGADAPSSEPHWLTYIGTSDLEATVAAAQRLGGRVVRAIGDVPTGGRDALLADPQGATFAVYAPAPGGDSGGMGDAFAWHELATSDYAAAFNFYRELFGWQQNRLHDMGAMGKYLLFGQGGKDWGGMFVRPPNAPGATPSWLLYARSANAGRAAEAAKAAGGRVINGPMEVPGGSWIAVLIDPQGATIAVNEPAPAARAAAPAAQPPSKPKAPAPAPAARPALKPAAAPAPKPAPAPAAPAAKPAAAPAPKPAAKTAAAPAPRKAAKKTKAKAAKKTKAKAAKKKSKRPAAPKRAPAKRKKAAARRTTGKKAKKRSASSKPPKKGARRHR
jgi:predicted enzyme related to lactoylglutathione lyase